MDKTKAVRAEVIRRLLAVSAVFLLGTGAAHACSPNLSQAQVDQANQLLDQNRSKDAFALMYPLSKEGSGGANRFLSEMYEKGRGVKCCIPDDHMAACETDPASPGTTASWPASASCCPVLTAAVGGCTRPHSAARSAPYLHGC